MKQFEREVAERIEANGSDEAQQAAAHQFMATSIAAKYSYNFSWLGRPIIQYPQDIVAMQELIWSLQPELIVETGIAHGGSLIFSASMLELNAACGGPADARVIGIDIDIRAHNRAAIEAHPMFRRITMIEGSSVAADVVAQVRALAKGKQSVLVCLDSNHTHEHVMAELEVYAPLTTV
ncbi:MAG TPA: CmcI family methyltransferase, partial [Caldimonas sp.]